MPRELIFTSVPSGVNPGSTGYCTVAKHKGIDRLLDRAVEEISFYEMMNSPTKPVVHAYRILRLNTGTFHVLSRIAYSGSDHTGRTNYIAHNLIFDQAETYAQTVSPAEIFLSGTGWLSEWPKGAPPAFLSEGTCKVSLPAASSTHASLQTWTNFTGKGALAHELGGRGQWKFITQGGDHQSALSLIAEYACLPGTANQQLCWSQHSFTTYLQPSDKPEDFNIIGGDQSVPAFAALSRDALNLGSPPNPGQCFSEAGSTSFGPLPALNQPPEAKAEPTAEPGQATAPTAGQAALAQEEAPDPFADDEPEAAAASPAQASNINLGPTDLPPEQKGPSDSPSGTRAYRPRSHRTIAIQAPKKSKAPIILLSIAGVGLMAAAAFAVAYFWDDLQKPTKEDLETAQSGSKEESSKQNAPSNNNNGSGKQNSANGGKEEKGQESAAEKEQKLKLQRNRDRLKALKASLENSNGYQNANLQELKDFSRKLEQALINIKKAGQKLSDKEAEDAQERKDDLAEQIRNKEAFEAAKNAAMNTTLPEKILIDDKFLPSGQFSLLPTGKPSDRFPKVYVYQAGKVLEKGDQPFPEVLWVDGTKIYLLKDKTYQMNISRFLDVKNIEEYGFIEPLEGIPHGDKLKVLTTSALSKLTIIGGVNDGTNDKRNKNFLLLANGFTAKCEITLGGDVLYHVTSNHESTHITFEDIKDVHQQAKLQFPELKKTITNAADNLEGARKDFRDLFGLSSKNKIDFSNEKFEGTIQNKIVSKIGKISFEWKDPKTDETKNISLPSGWNTGENVKKSIYQKKIREAKFPALRTIILNIVKDRKEGWDRQKIQAQKSLNEAIKKFDDNKDPKKKANLQKNKVDAENAYNAKKSLENDFKTKFNSSEFLKKYQDAQDEYSTKRANLIRYLADTTKYPGPKSFPQFESFINKLGVLSDEVKPPLQWRDKKSDRVIMVVK